MSDRKNCMRIGDACNVGIFIEIYAVVCIVGMWWTSGSSAKQSIQDLTSHSSSIAWIDLFTASRSRKGD
ncbi:hypothetical protein H634G_08522 [Metarhizium anisopliae BRIP 53293]|uniref:Uncharacterized protein n=1 Tax=Metarhizium anisopliae BRIP 53293 TaxID=1291518 RepID=A0A0D9NQG3_METAN|nr:hypothetical protein H634G_08522 [Metarhizium anisopliae BRIP 53293]KJK92019.1 hypothetical protein H633G_04157 [Metarhizium anisopliae BRIP 53284]